MLVPIRREGSATVVPVWVIGRLWVLPPLLHHTGFTLLTLIRKLVFVFSKDKVVMVNVVPFIVLVNVLIVV